MVKNMVKQNEVVITGLGVISPIGHDVESFWQSLITGKSGVATVTRFDASEFAANIGAEVKDFNSLQFMNKKDARNMDVFIQYAVAAAKQAIEDAGGMDDTKSERLGVSIGNCVGGLETLMENVDKMKQRGSSRVSPKMITKFIPNMAAYQISSIFGAKGPSLTISTACASSNDAIGEAMRKIQRGDADVMIAGGTESLFIPIVYAGLISSKSVSLHNKEPEKASRPFEKNRDGFVPGEGAGIVILESRKHAEDRGARIYCELAGYGTNGDGHNPTSPSPDGEGAIRAMHEALNDAGLEPQEIDYINAHATSTPVGDEIETTALKQVFGSYSEQVPVSSIKGHIGHLLGAAGAAEIIATVKAMETGIMPPTINLEIRDPKCDLDYVPNKAREKNVEASLSNSFGFGGQNASLVLRKNKNTND